MRAIETGYPREHQAAILCTTEYFCKEYRCVYGEDVEATLRFLFNAMAPKQIEGFLFQGIPKMIYLDNGPVARSHVFQQVMRYLDIDVSAHLPQGKDGRRVTARSKVRSRGHFAL